MSPQPGPPLRSPKDNVLLTKSNAALPLFYTPQLTPLHIPFILYDGILLLHTTQFSTGRYVSLLFPHNSLAFAF